MELNETLTYLAAAAAADAPIDGRERDLMGHLLKDFGADHSQARQMVKALPNPFTGQASLNTLESREEALKLLRALLVIAYCDGSFDKEEFPFLTPIVDKFSITGEELNSAKQQALYYLRLDPPPIKIAQELVASENWDEVCQQAHHQYEYYRQAFQKKFEEDLGTANEETCYLAMVVGPPTFDTEHAKNRFLQANPDFMHLDNAQATQMLRDEAESHLRTQWEAAYASRCNFCYLEAPGKRRDLCPRCQGEYGVSARR